MKSSATSLMRFSLLGITGILACLLLSPDRAQAITGDEVKRSVSAAIQWLLSAQGADGTWTDFGQPGGPTALATLALINAGVPMEQPAMRRALEATRRIPLQHTYVVSLKVQALAAADPRGYLREIQAGAEWLARAMHKNGMWGYDSTTEGHADFSNSQFAMLGLHEAARAGVDVPESVWRRAEQTLIQSQGQEGGWAYVPMGGWIPQTGSMTAAGVASLYITGNSLASRTESGFTATGEAPRCGKYSEHKPIARGLAWLAQNFNVDRNPGGGSHYFYYMYGIERVGILSGLHYFGRNDWYREGAAALLRRQHNDGHWSEVDSVVDTAFSLLFLAKGRRPLLFEKLQWSEDTRWNPDRNDLAHLIAFVGDRIGGPFSWEAVSFRDDVAEWQRAPMLYIQGHDFPSLRPAQIQKLRTYVQEGGTILAEACCSRSEFRAGFNAFAKVAFPEFPLHRLAREHPVFHSVFPLDGSSVHLEGIELGCRTSVFFSPSDLSCLWEQGDVPMKSKAAFELGTNIAAYATGLEPLPDKLDVLRVQARKPESQPSTAAASGAVYVAQLIHSGDWRPDPNALAQLATQLHDRMGVDVISTYDPLRATDPKLAGHPIVYMTGHFSFQMTPEEIAALRRHIERGGFLFVDAGCGRKSFDTSFRDLARQLFPSSSLERLPATHPIITGSPGVPLPTVTYKAALATEQPTLHEVVLEGISVGGRTAVVYSPYSIGCGLDGHACFACRGLATDDARKLACNIVLYALSY